MKPIQSKVILATLTMLCASPAFTLAQPTVERTTEEAPSIPSCNNGGVYSSVTKTCTDPISTSNIVSQVNANPDSNSAYDNKAFDRPDTTGRSPNRDSVISDDTSNTIQGNSNNSAASKNSDTTKKRAKNVRKNPNVTPGVNSDTHNTSATTPTDAAGTSTINSAGGTTGTLPGGATSGINTGTGTVGGSSGTTQGTPGSSR